MVLDWVLNFDINPLITLGISQCSGGGHGLRHGRAVATAAGDSGHALCGHGVNPIWCSDYRHRLPGIGHAAYNGG